VCAVAILLPGGCGIEEAQPLFRGDRCLGGGVRGNDADRVSRGHELHFVSHVDAISLDESLGQSNLKFAGHAGHGSRVVCFKDLIKDFSLKVAGSLTGKS